MKLHASRVYTIMGFMVALANSTMFTTYAVYQIIALGLNPFQLLLVGAVLEVTVLLFEGITGVIADTYSRRLSVIIGMFVLGFGFILEGSAIWLGTGSSVIPAFLWLLIAQLIFGVGATFVSGADTAWIVDEVGEEHAGGLFLEAKRIGLYGTLIGIGLSVGLSALAPNLPYVIGGLMYAVLGGFLLIYMKETKFTAMKRTADTSHWQNMKGTWVLGAQMIRRHFVLVLMLIVTLFSGAASEGYDRLWQAHFIMDIGFPQSIQFTAAAWFGIIAVLSTFLSLFAMGIAQRRLDMCNEHVVLRGMIVLTIARIAAILSVALSSNFIWVLVSVLILEVIRTMSGPMYDTWLNLNIESRSRATVLSMMSQSDALGQTVGGPLVGWVGNRFSVRASLVVAAVLLSPVLVLFSRALRKR
ncbi:MFS transporter [Paenibacillus sp. SYP-B3998]|uniref:MFS transporter n=1 Tax=Paenibacillus sp. SYP-B3998 TaxID=2678564 RepID=A0A6G3ZYW1_9BACL|nr:MFS transporter [Paenibacillus sp. SYP-B3998]NEW07406.1 MFS transporter [Paenibacillus sp. SYP-B3998]